MWGELRYVYISSRKSVIKKCYCSGRLVHFYLPAGSVYCNKALLEKRIQDNELLRRFPHHNLTAWQDGLPISSSHQKGQLLQNTTIHDFYRIIYLRERILITIFLKDWGIWRGRMRGTEKRGGEGGRRRGMEKEDRGGTRRTEWIQKQTWRRKERKKK